MNSGARNMNQRASCRARLCTEPVFKASIAAYLEMALKNLEWYCKVCVSVRLYVSVYIIKSV